MGIQIRQATLKDLPEITTLFKETVSSVNAKDYSDNQIKVCTSEAEEINK